MRDGLFTIGEVAAFLDIKRRAVRELIKAGKIQSIKIGWFQRVTAEAFDEYLKQRTREAI